MKITKKITLNLNEESLAKLDKIAAEKFRGVDRTKVIRWLIDDEWDRLNTDKLIDLSKELRALERTGD